jgi:hypothetical protein
MSSIVPPPPPREQLCNRYCSNKHTPRWWQHGAVICYLYRDEVPPSLSLAISFALGLLRGTYRFAVGLLRGTYRFALGLLRGTYQFLLFNDVLLRLARGLSYHLHAIVPVPVQRYGGKVVDGMWVEGARGGGRFMSHARQHFA